MPPRDPQSPLPYEAGRPASLPRLYGQTPTFLGSRPLTRPAEAADCDVVFLGVPWEGALTWGGYSGCELAAKAVRHASARYHGYLPEYDLVVHDHLRLGDLGDLAVVPGDPLATMTAIRAATRQVLQAGAKPVFFGGDHSYTPEVVAALAESVGGPVGVLHLDAHLDNLPDFGGDPLARCGPLYRVLQVPGVRAQSVVHLGIRGPRNAPWQMKIARDHGCRVYTMREMRERSLEAVTREALERVHAGTQAVYLTICSDILDALANPGGPADFDGLLPGELFRLVNQAARAGLAGLDLVEIYPPQDPQGRSAHLAVWTLVHALAGLAQAKGARVDGPPT